MNKKRETRAARRKRVMRNRAIAAGVLICIIIIVVVLIASGGKKAPSEKVASAETQTTADADSTDIHEEETETETTTEAVKPDNEKPVQLYTMDYSTMTCKKAASLNKAWSASEDLESFGAFCSSEDSFPFTSETQAHKDTWNSVQTDTDYKIGYELSFDLDGKKQVITILEPEDISSNESLYNGDYPEDGDYSNITGYLGVWVYDDMHQEEGAFYTHITQAEVTDETLLTSIKLRPTPQSDQIENLVLKAFSYSSDAEFDSDGHYAGQYASEISIGKE